MARCSRRIENIQLQAPQCLPGVSYAPFVVKMSAAVFLEEEDVPLNNVRVEWTTSHPDYMYLLPEAAIQVVSPPESANPDAPDPFLDQNGDPAYFQFEGGYTGGFAPSYYIGATDRFGVSSAWFFLNTDRMCEITQGGASQNLIWANIGVDFAPIQVQIQQAQINQNQPQQQQPTGGEDGG